MAVAKFLEKDERVAWVNYPGLTTDKYHDLAKKYCPNGTCGVMAFGMKGGREASKAVMSNLKLACFYLNTARKKCSY